LLIDNSYCNNYHADVGTEGCLDNWITARSNVSYATSHDTLQRVLLTLPTSHFTYSYFAYFGA